MKSPEDLDRAMSRLGELSMQFYGAHIGRVDRGMADTFDGRMNRIGLVRAIHSDLEEQLLQKNPNWALVRRLQAVWVAAKAWVDASVTESGGAP